MIEKEKIRTFETMKFKEIWTVLKYRNDEDYRKGKAYQVLVEIFESGINCMLNAGITLLWNLVTGDSANHLDNTNAKIEVGDNAGTTWLADTAYDLGDVVEPTTPDGNVYECTTGGTSGATEPSWVTGEGNTTTDNTVTWTCHTKTANAAQTHLNGDNVTQSAMEATFPIVSNQKVTFSGSYGSAEANHAWKECGVRYGVSGTMFNRVVADKGTKTSGETWVAKVEITGS